MKKLRRSLSLVLVFALVFSLCVGAFAGNFDEYKDADQITETYVEAADYLIAAGVIVGNGDGTLDPQGDLTREQAAKLVAYAMLGQTNADALAADTDPFDDVKKDSWSAGYVSYCQKQGIINGDGDGKFRPEDQVTGYEFGKMMLCALGYGVNDEYTGDNWSTNVGTDGLNRGLYNKVLDAASNSPITREQAFQIMFNACQMIPVQYNDSFKTYFAGSPMNGDPNINGYAGLIVDSRSLQTLGVQKFGISKDFPERDKNGRIGHYWNKKGDHVTDFYPDGEVVAELDGTEKPKAVESKLDERVIVIENGDEPYLDGKTPAEYASDRAKGGAKVELLDGPADYYYSSSNTGGNGKAEYIIITVEYLAKVIDVKPAKGDAPASIKLEVYDELGDSVVKTVTEEDYDISGFAKDDFVLIVPNAADHYFSTPISIEKAEPTVAAVEAYSSKDVTFDGEKHEFGLNAYHKESSYQFKDATYSFYFNSGDKLIGSEKDKVAPVVPDYVYIETVQFKVPQPEDLFDGAAAGAARAKGYLTDGTEVTFDLALVNDPANPGADPKVAWVDQNGNAANKELSDSTGALYPKVYTYTTDSEGFVTLSEKVIVPVGPDTYTGAVEAASVKVTAGKADVVFGSGTMYANANTNLVVVGKDGATTYTGYANFPGDKDGVTYTVSSNPEVKDSCEAIFYVTKGSVVTDIVVIGVGEPKAPEETLTLVALGGGAETRPDPKGNEQDYYNFIDAKSGEMVSFYGGAQEKGTVLVVKVKDEGYTVVGGTPTGAAQATVADADRIVVGENVYYFTADSLVYDMREFENELVEGSIKPNDYVQLVLGEGPDADKIVYAFIVNDPT